MTESATPICDLIESLMSRDMVSQMSRDTVFETARKIEAALGRTAKSSGSEISYRDKERLRKAAYRSRLSQNVPGQKRGPLLTEELPISQSKNKKVRKEEPACPVLSRDKRDIPTDDWPADFLDQFWIAFPPFRRQAKAKVGAKLVRIRAGGDVTWAKIIGGVHKFAGTNPGEYAPAPMVWLNDGRWDREYGPQQRGGFNGKTQDAHDIRKAGFAGLAARLRHGAPNSESERPAPEDLQPVNGR